jgi:uncharacterized protein YbjT (DUF2867 family)
VGERILVTGASGNVGREVVRALLRERAEGRWDGAVVRAVRAPEAETAPGTDAGVLRFGEPATYSTALEGVTRLFLMRPPQIGNVRRDMFPFVDAARAAGVRQVVLLSLLGAEDRPYVPHRRLERAILAAGLPWTFLRPSFYMQNLSTTHRREIRERGEIMVPAGRSRTGFVDTRDVGEVAALALTRPGHAGQAYDLTGPEALDYSQVAALFSEVLGRKVVYRDPSLLAFVRYRLSLGDRLPFVLVMAGLYAATRAGGADAVTGTVERLLGRPPTTLRAFVAENARLWEPPGG